MALVKYGNGITQMSGSIGGDTHGRNRYGNYIRARTKPVNPRTSRQVKVRSIMAMLVERWSETLNAAQRTAWNLYGNSVSMKNKLGEAIFLSGFNHYIRSNGWRVELGRAIVDAGPIVFELPGQDPEMAIAVSEATQLVTITFDDGLAWCSEDEGMLTILEGTPQNVQRNFFGGPYKGRSGKIGNSGAPITSPQDYTAIHVLSEGQRVWVKFRIAREDGRISEPFTANVIIAA